MDVFGIALSVLGGLMLIIGYFLKMIHSDVRTNTTETGRNKGKIEQLQIQINNEREMRQEQLNSQYKQISTSIEALQRSIETINLNIQSLIEKK